MRRFLPPLIVVMLLLLNGCPARKGEVADRSRMTARAEPQSEQIGLLKLPAGFRAGLFASRLRAPRMMALSPDGRLFVTEMRAGRVTILPDANGDGRADGHVTYASGLNEPHGIAFHGGYLYIAETGRVIRYRYREGDMKAPRPNVVVPDLPAGGGHFTRTISFGPDGKLYVSVGSSCNVCIEKSPLRAAITRYDADGSDRRIVATGLRNSVGLAWNPKTDELWATDNGRDYLGDDLPPEEINVIREGGFYGWPYAYGDRVPDPEFGDRAPAKVSSSVPPKIKMQAHSAPLGLAFYTGDMFPAEYRGGRLEKIESLRPDLPAAEQYESFVAQSKWDSGASVVAELGIGINPQADPFGDFPEAEEARCTCHFEFGMNIGLGGSNRSSVHFGGAVYQPTIYVDGVMVIDKGSLVR